MAAKLRPNLNLVQRRKTAQRQASSYYQPPPVKIKCLLCGKQFDTFNGLEAHCDDRHKQWAEEFARKPRADNSALRLWFGLVILLAECGGFALNGTACLF